MRAEVTILALPAGCPNLGRRWCRCPRDVGAGGDKSASPPDLGRMPIPALAYAGEFHAAALPVTTLISNLAQASPAPGQPAALLPRYPVRCPPQRDRVPASPTG